MTASRSDKVISARTHQTAIDATHVLRKLPSMRDKTSTILCLLGLAGMLAGCGIGSSLSTGSVLGGSQTAAAPAPKPISPSERALYVGATVARAQRCGFYFEPEQVKASYIAAESQAGTPPEIVQKATKEFDFTRQSILLVSSIAPTDFLGPNDSDMGAAPYHLWTGGADADVNGCADCDVCQTFHLLDRADVVCVGGAMANTFLLAQGTSVEDSLVEKDRVDVARQHLSVAWFHDQSPIRAHLGAISNPE